MLQSIVGAHTLLRIADFFKRGRAMARLADQGKPLAAERVIAYEDPEELARILTSAKVALFRAIKEQPGSITDIATRLNLETSVDRSVALVSRLEAGVRAFDQAHPLGGAATHSIARFSRRLAALLLLAGPAPPRRLALPDSAKTAHSGASN